MSNFMYKPVDTLEAELTKEEEFVRYIKENDRQIKEKEKESAAISMKNRNKTNMTYVTKTNMTNVMDKIEQKLESA